MRSIPVAGPLRCPRDGREMRPFTVADVEVDRCQACEGLWLDPGELRRVALDEELEVVVRANIDGRESIRCPRCEGMCHVARVAGVELDACSECTGIWLDRGELRDARLRMLAGRQEARGLARLVVLAPA